MFLTFLKMTSNIIEMLKNISPPLNPMETTDTSKRVFMISTYNPTNPNLGKLLRDNWELLNLKPETQTLYNSQLIVGNRRAKNLKEQLVKAQIRFPPTETNQSPVLDHNTCTRKNCKYCPYINNSSVCRSKITSRTNKTPQVQASCRSTNLV